MRATTSVAPTGRYVLTDIGRADLQNPARCVCTIKIVGFWLICPQCETCYGNLRDQEARYR